MKGKKWLLLAVLLAVAYLTVSLWAPPLAGLLGRGSEGPPASAVESPVPTPEPTPTPTPPPAEMDESALKRGVVGVRYVGPCRDRVKVKIALEDGEAYHFDLNTAGEWERYPLTQGDGVYTVTVLEQVEGTLYQPVQRWKVTVALDDPLAPFLEPNQYVNYTPDSAAVRLAGELTAGLESDLDKTAALFDYVTGNLTYDKDKAALAQEGEILGYLPDVDQVLEEGKAICFDYAALLCAMLRSQGIPCRMALGNVSEGYHAWVEVWCETAGVIDGIIPVEGNTWTLLDPTFVSGRKAKGEDPLIASGWESYETKYVY